MKFTVIEMQNGVVGGNVWTYDTLPEAEAEYHSVLAVAAVSSVYKHGAAILNEYCFCVKHECYDRTPAPEPPESENAQTA